MLATAGRGFVATAIAAAVLSVTAYAQTDPSGSRPTTQGSSQTTVVSAPTTATKTKPARRTSATKKRVATASRSRRARHSTATAMRPVKIVIHGDRTDVQQARQQGMQSLQNANAAVAERNAAAQDAAANAAANDAALANAQNNNNFPSPYYGYGYGYGSLPTFVDPSSPYANVPNLPYGSSSTVSPFVVGASPLGAPLVNFPSYYNTYAPGVFQTYISSPYGGTFGMYGY